MNLSWRILIGHHSNRSCCEFGFKFIEIITKNYYKELVSKHITVFIIVIFFTFGYPKVHERHGKNGRRHKNQKRHDQLSIWNVTFIGWCQMCYSRMWVFLCDIILLIFFVKYFVGTQFNIFTFSYEQYLLTEFFQQMEFSFGGLKWNTSMWLHIWYNSKVMKQLSLAT